jgi:hypothetical protein
VTAPKRSRIAFGLEVALGLAGLACYAGLMLLLFPGLRQKLRPWWDRQLYHFRLGRAQQRRAAWWRALPPWAKEAWQVRGRAPQ